MTVGSILRRKGVQVEMAWPHTSVGEASRRMTEKGIGSLVVVDDRGSFIGLISERDLVGAFAEHGPASWTHPIGDLLTAHAPTCKPSDPLRLTMVTMTRRRARHLPVVAGGAVVGIISIGDAVKGVLEELELEVGVLRDYARARL